MEAAITGAAIGFLVWLLLTTAMTTQHSHASFPFKVSALAFVVFVGTGLSLGWFVSLIGGAG